jgi:mRNA interferase MazF
MFMPNSSTNDIILVRYPFSDLSGAKVRPAVVVSAPHVSQDIFIVPLTSKTAPLLAGEFLLADWKAGGLNVPTAAKRGLYTVQQTLVAKTIGQLTPRDSSKLQHSLRGWLGLS